MLLRSAMLYTVCALCGAAENHHLRAKSTDLGLAGRYPLKANSP
jgi:hypothetical protein